MIRVKEGSVFEKALILYSQFIILKRKLFSSYSEVLITNCIFKLLLAHISMVPLVQKM